MAIELKGSIWKSLGGLGYIGDASDSVDVVIR